MGRLPRLLHRHLQAAQRLLLPPSPVKCRATQCLSFFPPRVPENPSNQAKKNPTPPTTTLPQWPSLTSRMTPTKTTFTPHVFPSPSSSSSSLSFPSPNPRHDLTRDVPFSSLSPLSLLLLFPPFPIPINPKYPVPAYPSNN